MRPPPGLEPQGNHCVLGALEEAEVRTALGLHPRAARCSLLSRLETVLPAARKGEAFRPTGRSVLKCERFSFLPTSQR